jgi:hypothetical protein
MGLNQRLQRLEGNRHLLGDECPDCGAWLGPPEEAEIVVEWWDGWEETEDGELVESTTPVAEPTICPTCLEPSHIVITWEDLPEVEQQFDHHRSDRLRQERDGIEDTRERHPESHNEV